MFLMDLFLDGVFLTYGIEVISFAGRDQEDRIDPMVYIFPRMTKYWFMYTILTLKANYDKFFSIALVSQKLHLFECKNLSTQIH